jgi:hypothetical protein
LVQQKILKKFSAPGYPLRNPLIATSGLCRGILGAVPNRYAKPLEMQKQTAMDRGTNCLAAS